MFHSYRWCGGCSEEVPRWAVYVTLSADGTIAWLDEDYSGGCHWTEHLLDARRFLTRDDAVAAARRTAGCRPRDADAACVAEVHPSMTNTRHVPGLAQALARQTAPRHQE